MKPSEQKALAVLEKAFTVGDKLELYVFEIQNYFSDETNQLAIDNLKLEDYLTDVIPELIKSYDNTKKSKWLRQLRKILYQAKEYAKPWPPEAEDDNLYTSKRVQNMTDKEFEAKIAEIDEHFKHVREKYK